MLPLYPQLKIKLEKLFVDVMETSSRSQLGPFQDSPRFTQHEGTKHRYNTVDGHQESTDYQEFKAEFLINNSDLPGMTFEDALKVAVEKGRELGVQQAKYHYQKLDQITTEAGNVVNGPITLETFLKMLEKLHISFDNLGNPRMPTMVISPSMAQRVQELASQAEQHEGAKSQMNEIIERKRREWNEEQDRRQLVD